MLNYIYIPDATSTGGKELFTKDQLSILNLLM
jgi:hypothetical protein